MAVLCVKSGLRSGPGFIDALMWWCPSCASVPLEKSGSSWWRGQAHQLLVSPSAPNCLESSLFASRVLFVGVSDRELSFGVCFF